MSAASGSAADENWECHLQAGIAWQFHKNTYLDLAYRARGQWQNLGSLHDIAVSGWGDTGLESWSDLQILVRFSGV